MLTLTLAAILFPPAATTDVAQAGTPERTARDALVSNLDLGLRGTPMAGTAGKLEEAGARYGIHPAFLAGVAAFEGGFDLERHTGKTPCLPFNPFGVSSCGDAWRAPAFRSWGHAYNYVARFLATRWPSATSVYSYHGFCTCGATWWGGKVAAKMRQLGYPPLVRYRR